MGKSIEKPPDPKIARATSLPDPIKKELLGYYPIDWRQLSAVIRFERAKGRCESCGRPHGKVISHLGDGRWFDPASEIWRDGQGRAIAWIDFSQY